MSATDRYSGFGSKEPEFRGRNPTLGTPDSHFRRWRICTLGTPDSHFERGRICTLGTPDSHFGRGRICTLRAPDLQFRRGRICTLGAPDSHFARGQRNPTLRNSGFALQQDLWRQRIYCLQTTHFKLNSVAKCREVQFLIVFRDEFKRELA